MAGELIFYYAPQTRATGVRLLLEDLGVRYVPHRVQLRDPEARETFRSVNPMIKVPAIRHDGALVTEQVAIFIYLADAFPDAGLAPAIGDPLRGPYLRWLVYYGSCVEPAAVDRAMKRDSGGRAMSPYADFETTVATITDQLRTGPWILGERFTAADILWGTALSWLTRFEIIPKGGEVAAYLDRFEARPSVRAVRDADAAEAEAA